MSCYSVIFLSRITRVVTQSLLLFFLMLHTARSRTLAEATNNHWQIPKNVCEHGSNAQTIVF
jgi:hypothetical protein